VDIRNDITNLSFATPRAVQDITGIDKSANERLLLLADATVTLEIVFNPTGAHTVFSTVPSTSACRTRVHRRRRQDPRDGDALHGLPAAALQHRRAHRVCPAVLADGTVPTWA
jgi:hypothetical protein